MNSSVNIEVNIKPIVELVCLERQCRFNASNSKGEHFYASVSCSLKMVRIGEGGKCLFFENQADSVAE